MINNNNNNNISVILSCSCIMNNTLNLILCICISFSYYYCYYYYRVRPVSGKLLYSQSWLVVYTKQCFRYLCSSLLTQYQYSTNTNGFLSTLTNYYTTNHNNDTTTTTTTTTDNNDNKTVLMFTFGRVRVRSVSVLALGTSHIC